MTHCSSEDQTWVPSTHVRWPVIPSPGDLTPFSHIFRHVHIWHENIHILINKNDKKNSKAMGSEGSRWLSPLWKWLVLTSLFQWQSYSCDSQGEPPWHCGDRPCQLPLCTVVLLPGPAQLFESLWVLYLIAVTCWWFVLNAICSFQKGNCSFRNNYTCAVSGL